MMSIARQRGVDRGRDQTFSDSNLQHHSCLSFRWFIDVGYDRDLDDVQMLRRPRPKTIVLEHVQPAVDKFYKETHMENVRESTMGVQTLVRDGTICIMRRTFNCDGCVSRNAAEKFLRYFAFITHCLALSNSCRSSDKGRLDVVVRRCPAGKPAGINCGPRHAAGSGESCQRPHL